MAQLMEFCLRSFPSTGGVREATGLPFAAIMQPAAKIPASVSASMQGQLPAFMDVLRCGKCFGYINCHCDFQPPAWQCSLCNHVNTISQLWKQRYNRGLEDLPELRYDTFEMLMDELGPFSADQQGNTRGPAPILVAVVDLTGGEEWLELVRSALLAALEALPPYTLFGLVTFSHQLGLHDVRSHTPSVRLIHLTESPAQPLELPCSQVMPLHAFLSPIGQYKDRIITALEALAPQSSQPGFHQPSQNGQQSGDGQAPTSMQPPGMDRSGIQTGRALGPALLGLLDYLNATSAPPFRPSDQGTDTAVGGGGNAALPPVQSPIRLMTFVAGPPNLGAGSLLNPTRHAITDNNLHQVNGGHTDKQAHTTTSATTHLPADDSWLQDVDPSAERFYRQAAVAAAAVGACCDLYAISEGAVGLQYLQPLADATGGAVYMYPSVEESALPQDVYRRLSGSHATQGVLRLRCSPAMKPARHYGRLVADEQIENLHHIVSCCESDTFAVDFELNTPQGFTAPGCGMPIVQMAFQYTTVVPASHRARPASRSQLLMSEQQVQRPHSSPGTVGSLAAQQASTNGNGMAAQTAVPAEYVIQRRLKVATYKLGVADNPLAVMRSCSWQALLVVLLHKVLRVVQSQGSTRARVVLRDWLANLATSYHNQLHAATATQGPAALLQIPVDVSFAQAEALQPIPRLVYALLRSPLLAPAIDAQHPDLVNYMTHLWCSLPPRELQRAVYPALSSYADPDTLVLSRHSLSRGALLADGAPPIFFMDAYVLLVVMYTRKSPAGLPFPPPQTSALRKTIAAIRQERRITPQVRFVREGTEDAALFFHLLLDEPDQPDTTQAGGPRNSASQFGLVQFLEHIRMEVIAALQAEAQQKEAA